MLGEVCPVVVSKYAFQRVESPSNGGPNYEALKVERKLLPYICRRQMLQANGKKFNIEEKGKKVKLKKIELYAGTSENLEILIEKSKVKIFKCGQSAGKARINNLKVMA